MGFWERARTRVMTVVLLLGVGFALASLSARLKALLSAEPRSAGAGAEAGGPPELAVPAGPPGPEDGPLAWAIAVARGGLLHTASDGETTPDAPPSESADTCPASPGPLALLATMAADPPTWSMAIVADGGPDTRLVKEGQALGDYTVHTIARERLVLSRGGRYECVALGPRHRPTPASSARALARSPAPRASGIRALGSDRYSIPHGFVSDLMDHPESVSGEARAVPSYRDGQANGFKLMRVRRGGLLGELGVRSGDVLVGVDGAPVRSANDVLKVYARLAETSHLSLEFERGGRRRTVEIDLP